MTKSNLKPADELFQLRLTLRRLRQREAELKQMIQTNAAAMTGELAVCHWRKCETMAFNRKQAEAELGSLSRFYYRKEPMRLCVMLNPRRRGEIDKAVNTNAPISTKEA